MDPQRTDMLVTRRGEYPRQAIRDVDPHQVAGPSRQLAAAEAAAAGKDVTTSAPHWTLTSVTNRLFGQHARDARFSTPATGHNARDIISPGISRIATEATIHEEDEAALEEEKRDESQSHKTAPSAPPVEPADDDDDESFGILHADEELERYKRNNDRELGHLQRGLSQVQESIVALIGEVQTLEAIRIADEGNAAARLGNMEAKSEELTQKLIEGQDRHEGEIRRMTTKMDRVLDHIIREEKRASINVAAADDTSASDSEDQVTMIQRRAPSRHQDELIPRIIRPRAATMPKVLARPAPPAPHKRRDSVAADGRSEAAITSPARETQEKEKGKKEAVASMMALAGRDQEPGTSARIPAVIAEPIVPALAPVVTTAAGTPGNNDSGANRMDSSENFSRFKFLSRQLPSFSGRPDEGYDQFEAVLTRFVQQHHLSDADALIVLKECLVRGSAAWNWLAMEEHKAVLRHQADRPFADVLKAMREKYGIKVEDREHVAKEMKMTVFETAEDYIDRKMIAMMQAGVTSKVICLRALQNGILPRYRSEVARMSALIEREDTLDKATELLKIVLRDEMKRQKEGLEQQVTLVTAAAPTTVVPSSPPLTKSVLEKAMAQLRAAIAQNDQERLLPPVANGSFAPRMLHTNGQQCYNCQATDHFIKECPYPNPRVRRSGPPRWRSNSGNANPGDVSATSFRQ